MNRVIREIAMTEDGSNSNKENIEKMEKMVESLKDRIEPTEEQLKKLKEISNKYSGKSEEELLFEVIKLNRMFSENMSEEEYKERMNKLEMIRPLLNEEQKMKLDKLVAILRKTE